MLAGGLSAEQLHNAGADIDEGVQAAVDAAVEHNADLDRNAAGYCEGVSAVLEFDAVPAFLFED